MESHPLRFPKRRHLASLMHRYSSGSPSPDFTLSPCVCHLSATTADLTLSVHRLPCLDKTLPLDPGPYRTAAQGIDGLSLDYSDSPLLSVVFWPRRDPLLLLDSLCFDDPPERVPKGRKYPRKSGDIYPPEISGVKNLRPESLSLSFFGTTHSSGHKSMSLNELGSDCLTTSLRIPALQDTLLSISFPGTLSPLARDYP